MPLGYSTTAMRAPSDSARSRVLQKWRVCGFRDLRASLGPSFCCVSPSSADPAQGVPPRFVWRIAPGSAAGSGDASATGGVGDTVQQ